MHAYFITTAWCPSDFEDGCREHVSTPTVRKSSTPVWLHFCLKATEDGTVIIGELFARPVAKSYHKSRQKSIAPTCLLIQRICSTAYGT